MKKAVWLIYFVALGRAFATGNPGDSAVRWWPSAVGIQAGTTGVGVQWAWKLRSQPRLVLRVGATYVAYKKKIQIDLGDSSLIEFRPDFVIGVVHSSVKWHPFPRSAFFLTGGLGYTWRPDIQLELSALSPIELGGIQMKPDEFGTIGLGIKWSPVVGYAGFGFGRSIPKRRWGVGVELGCYYLGAPKINMEFDGFLETTTLEEQIPLIERNMRGYRYLPNLQLVITYALVKKSLR
ncbi:hypothetical protein DR864_04350 [Runella rosea]|uniref:Outer membrane protein beta-barrel domain-containing protein n=1 Tax=Runella rosea TaxID=2259595 RepID=A0A344TEE7_9BACT|nr:hypothetical protein [Runella rosea]AXE17018.1 hypothetical protein DR864_04350 [Runella rosea]